MCWIYGDAVTGIRRIIRVNSLRMDLGAGSRRRDQIGDISFYFLINDGFLDKGKSRRD